jgi:amino-acid N-acetyltransferase
MRIRKAVIADVKAIHQLLNHYADQKLLLPRSLSELYDHVRGYFVLDDGTEEPHRIIGVCGLGICWEDLAEIRSLAVFEGVSGKGYGTKLVKACLKEARLLGVKRVFALTYVPGFFLHMGFQEVDKSVLPHKIWGDCLKCPKFPQCDETALMIEL